MRRILISSLLFITAVHTTSVVHAQSLPPILLSCVYDASVNRSDSKAIGIVPEIIELAADLSEVKFDGQRVVVEKLSDASVTLTFRGWSYSLSRISGELKFHSPAGIERSKARLKAALGGAIIRGTPSVEAEAEVKRQEVGIFDAHQYAGQCRKAEKRLF